MLLLQKVGGCRKRLFHPIGQVGLLIIADDLILFAIAILVLLGAEPEVRTFRPANRHYNSIRVDNGPTEQYVSTEL